MEEKTRPRKSSIKNHAARNKANEDLSIDVWNAHGLKGGSNILKFGIRNKNIVLIVHHAPNMPNFNIDAKTSHDFSSNKSNSAFVKSGDATKKVSLI